MDPRFGNPKHGHGAKGRESPTYQSWLGMVQRCTNPNSGKWARYGGRGITVCERWLTFANFLADMGERPNGLFIERKNNDGNYEPGNCRWATRVEQARNTRLNHMLTHNGETLCLAGWAERAGIKQNTLKMRIRRGWSVARALAALEAP